MMDDGEVRTEGDYSFVDILLGGRARRVSVSREAIEEHLGLSPNVAAEMSAEARRQFVQTNFMLVVTAADKKLERSGGPTDVIVIEMGDL
jgi:hypothetical protein